MRVRLWTWGLNPKSPGMSTWLDQGEMHLDEAAVRLDEPMLSVAWDRDVPGLVPQPKLTREEHFDLYGPTGQFSIRLFCAPGRDSRPFGKNGRREDVSLSFIDGQWQWRGNGLGGSDQPRVLFNGDTVTVLPQKIEFRGSK